MGVEQIFLRLLRGISQKQKELGRNPARLDTSGYPEAAKLKPRKVRKPVRCSFCKLSSTYKHLDLAKTSSKWPPRQAITLEEEGRARDECAC